MGFSWAASAALVLIASSYQGASLAPTVSYSSFNRALIANGSSGSRRGQAALMAPSPVFSSYLSSLNNSSPSPVAPSFSQASSTGEAAGQDGEALFEPLLKGIKRDYAARLPMYISDITDGLNTQCLAAVAFLFFACLAPAIGFGALFGTVTNGAIGTMEMVCSTAACGMIYALTSAQPLTIIGSTGPVLAFVATLVKLANKFDLPFLPLYTWTGLWTSGILFVSAITSGSNAVKYLTRFTDEIFSTLISFIFVTEAISDIAGSFGNLILPKALLTLVCAVVTFTTATILKGVRNTPYFSKSVRKNLSNFAPTIGVVSASLIARWARLAHGTEMAGLKVLTMPGSLATTSGRPWLVPLFTLPVWARWAAIVPALMAFVLLFLDQNITVRLVNSPSYKMKKGRREGNVLDGMNADLLVISLLTGITSLFGIPWLVAATVRSISHVRALGNVDATDGSTKSTIEQRVTGFSIHALIGACIAFSGPRNLLTNVPLSVLMGLFMYLGTSALPGNEMWERIKEIFKDPFELKPNRWSNVPRKITTFFTVTQVACLAAMVYVKGSPLGVLFPVVIAMLAPLRFALEKTGLVKKEYMDVLDED
mmetsp:Transcript_61466/g.73943  ORF Transcript_61466/g.73943 Transcript_61466/m.73943 type:complete len:596 (-) Transcript_61466:144-1931(-)